MVVELSTLYVSDLLVTMLKPCRNVTRRKLSEVNAKSGGLVTVMVVVKAKVVSNWRNQVRPPLPDSNQTIWLGSNGCRTKGNITTC